jgi:hypothetical protein
MTTGTHSCWWELPIFKTVYVGVAIYRMRSKKVPLLIAPNEILQMLQNGSVYDAEIRQFIDCNLIIHWQ